MGEVSHAEGIRRKQAIAASVPVGGMPQVLRVIEDGGNVTDKDLPRDPQDKIDCLGYIELAGPTFVDRYRRTDSWDPIYPSIGYQVCRTPAAQPMLNGAGGRVDVVRSAELGHF